MRSRCRAFWASVSELARRAWEERKRYRMLTPQEALLLLLNISVLPVMLWTSSLLLTGASVFLARSFYPHAALVIFVNNLMAAGLISLTATTARRLSWVWALSSEAVSRNAGKAALLFTTCVFAASLYMRRHIVSPILFFLPHFWLEYMALAVAAYAGFKPSLRAFAASAALLAVAALFEVAAAATFASR